MHNVWALLSHASPLRSQPSVEDLALRRPTTSLGFPARI